VIVSRYPTYLNTRVLTLNWCVHQIIFGCWITTYGVLYTTCLMSSLMTRYKVWLCCCLIFSKTTFARLILVTATYPQSVSHTDWDPAHITRQETTLTCLFRESATLPNLTHLMCHLLQLTLNQLLHWLRVCTRNKLRDNSHLSLSRVRHALEFGTLSMPFNPSVAELLIIASCQV